MGYSVFSEEKTMKTWYVKELSRMNNVSIRTLHYYDKIGLLKPSDRLSNGYRVYSEKDVKKLEQIIALKFFGFTLARIKQILSHQELTLEQLETQLLLLQSEVSFLQEAQRNLLHASIKEFRKNSSIDWHQIAKLINDYTQASKELTLHAQKTLSEQGPRVHQELTHHQDIWHKLISKINSFENDSNT